MSAKTLQPREYHANKSKNTSKTNIHCRVLFETDLSTSTSNSLKC